MIEQARNLLATAVNQVPEEVPDNAMIGGLEGWDSLAHIRLIVALEGHLGRSLTTDEVVSISSLESIARVMGS